MSGWRNQRKRLLGLLLCAVFALPTAHAGPPRNPFWPVGYRPPDAPVPDDPQEVEELELQESSRIEEAWTAAHARLSIHGVSRLGEHRVALINGQPVRPGSLISVRHDGRLFRWRVSAIDQAGIRLERVDVTTLPAP